PDHPREGLVDGTAPAAKERPAKRRLVREARGDELRGREVDGDKQQQPETGRSPVVAAEVSGLLRSAIERGLSVHWETPGRGVRRAFEWRLPDWKRPHSGLLADPCDWRRATSSRGTPGATSTVVGIIGPSPGLCPLTSSPGPWLFR